MKGGGVDFLAELQKRGFEVVQCPGRLTIASNMRLRREVAANGVTIRDQVNAHLCDLIPDRTTESLPEHAVLNSPELVEGEGDDSR